MHKIDIIIVNYRNNDLLDKCIEAIKLNEYDNYQIHIWDNSNTNLGPAIGFNKLIKECNGDYVVILASDMEIDKNFLEEIVDWFRISTVDAIAPKIYNGFTNKLDYIGAYLTWTGFLIYRQQGHKEDIGQFNEYTRVTCNAIAFRKELLDKLNGFDEDYFMYLEDSDLCIRAILLGYTIMYIPSAIIHHHSNAGINMNPKKDFVINYYGCRNYIITLLKNLSIKNLYIILPIHLFLWFMFGLIKGKLVYYLLAIKDVLKNWDKIMVKREKIQKTRIVGDKELIVKLPTLRMLWGKIIKGKC